MAIGTPIFTAVGRGKYVELAVAVTGATLVTISRLGMGQIWTIVRGADKADIADGLFQGYDWEAPQGTPLTYRAQITDGTNTVIVDIPMAGAVNYGGDWIMPVGRVELGMNITVEKGGVAGLDREVIRDVVKVVNRPSPMVVSWGRKLWASTWSLITMEDTERRRFLRILDYPVIMFAARAGYGFDEPIFASVGQVTEERTSGEGSETSRRWSVEMQQIARPPASYVPPAPSSTWQERKDELMTWGDIIASPGPITWFDYAGYGEVEEETL